MKPLLMELPAPAARLAVHYSSKTPEHYTPPEIVKSAVTVLGRIDLDPCSNSKTDPIVPAAAHYTAEDDGLTLPWRGTVYMNPPYGRGIGLWIDKFCAAYSLGQVSAAIALVPARTDTRWWQRLNGPRPLVCFVAGRLAFLGNRQSAPFPSAVVYLGSDLAAFYREFGSHGEIYRRL